MAGIIQLSDLGLYPKIDYAGVGWLVSPMIMLDHSNREASYSRLEKSLEP